MRWYLGFSDNKETMPKEFTVTTVPNDVQLAYSNKAPEYYHFGSNYRECKWMEDKWWFFRTRISVSKREGVIPFLVFKGLDYRYTIYLNEIQVYEDEGMFTPVSICLSDYENSDVQITVLLHPIPKKSGVQEGKDEASLSCIPPVSYGWDWHPRLVPIGIYDDVELIYRPETDIAEVDLSYDISEDLEEVTGKITAYVTNPDGIVIFELADDSGDIIFEKRLPAAYIAETDFTVDHPNLWWCIGQGLQSFYHLKLSIEINGQGYIAYEKRIGFRKVRLVMNEDAWEGKAFPKTQGKAPITIELNGRKIFGKGTNLVPSEIFTSQLNKDIYKKIVTLAKDCNMNLLRLWGGGLVNKESFFELCDEMGLMVWQEFPLACNNYENDQHYLSVLDKESKSILKRLKKHPCVIMWCGGNELFCSWGGMTNQSHALRLLDKNCFELDKNTPFMHTSPLYGMGHGHYMLFSDKDTECLTNIVNSDFTAYTEFGVPSPSSFDYIKTFTPEDELYRVEAGTAWEHHHAVNSWDYQKNTWFCIDQISRYFGKEEKLEQIIENGLVIQGEVYKNMYEEARRKWPKTSMALNWCFNEPWPTAANNSIINYPDIPKPSYYKVKEALRDQILSARFNKMIWAKGETMTIDIFALNDSPELLAETQYSVLIYSIEGQKLGGWSGLKLPLVPGNSTLKAASFDFTLPETTADKFIIKLISDNDILNNEYLLFTPDKK